MNARSPHHARLAATFWLLATAWICANIRPGVPGALLSWLSESARFSHQQRLTSQVAELLGGQKPVAASAHSESPSKPPANPLALADSTFKKLEVPLTRPTRLLARASVTIRFSNAELGLTGWDRAAPPHGPPRAGNVS
jgi:hypothetical protein